MKAGTFATARLMVLRPELEIEVLHLQHASIQVHSTGFVEIIHYKDGVKQPSNKRTVIMPGTSLQSFVGYGYAN